MVVFKDTSVGGLIAGFMILLLAVVLLVNSDGTVKIIGTIGKNAVDLSRIVVNPKGG